MLLIQHRASEIIAQIFDSNRNLTELLNETFHDLSKFSPQERGAIQDISYGTLRFYGLINQLLQSLLHKPIVDQPIRYLLLISLYQLIFTKAKTHAIVHSAVDNAEKLGKTYAKGLINAILRRFLREKDSLLKAAEQTLVGHYSHPQWWIKKMQEAYPQDWENILLANNEHPPLTLRVNRRKIQGEDYLHLLEKVGISAQLLGPYSVMLSSPVPISQLPHFFDGYVCVQDRGAQLAAELLDVKEGMRVLDACAAPGGKTSHILELADVTLTALDNNSQRLKRVADNLLRLNLTATLICQDASKPEKWWDGIPFDRILADVPCSASGVVRRHPDIKWRRRPEDIAQFASQQTQLLDQLWSCLRKKGKLLYTTCSVFPEENSEQVTAFLSRHTDAIHLKVPLNNDGQLLPVRENDGFYYALFEKK